MTAKEKAKELVSKHMPLVYCYVGSGMLTNDYDEKIAIGNAKKSALIAVDEVINSKHAWNKTKGPFADYWQEVKQEIINL